MAASPLAARRPPRHRLTRRRRHNAARSFTRFAVLLLPPMITRVDEMPVVGMVLPLINLNTHFAYSPSQKF